MPKEYADDDELVATVLTVYGIETKVRFSFFTNFFADFLLQQYLPFTVLKLNTVTGATEWKFNVATVLTVYGIETVYI